MFSFVIPTFWACDISKFDSLVDKLTTCDSVSEILIVNNAPYKYSHRYSYNSKVKELVFQDIYLYQSWNIGVYQSKNDFICLMSDMVEFNLDVMKFIHSEMSRNDFHILGVAKECLSIDEDSEYSISKIEMRNKYWATLLFTKKDKYTWIPDDFRVYFGDDYLIQQSMGHICKLNGLKVRVTNSLFDGINVDEIINNDTTNSYKYSLPLSYDY